MEKKTKKLLRKNLVYTGGKLDESVRTELKRSLLENCISSGSSTTSDVWSLGGEVLLWFTFECLCAI